MDLLSDMDPEKERALLDAVAAGDERSFRLLVDSYWKRIYGNTLTLVRSAQVAQEITQDIFLKIWRKREKLSAVISFKEYIYVVGKHEVISQMRKKMMLVTAEPEDIIEENISPVRQLEYKETLRIIKEGVEQLTPQQQKIFTMSRFEGKTYEEIADELGLSRNTIKGHMVLALNFLRTYVRDHNGLTLIGFLIAQFILRK